MVTLEEIKNNETVKELIVAQEKVLNVLGYTEHSLRHLNIVSNRAAQILTDLGFSEEKVELVRIAGYLHDIGNAINRTDHAHTGAILANDILKELGMNVKDRTEIMMAIGNHDEKTGTAINEISAALILADKSDAHRDRVVQTSIISADKHNKVNYAVTSSNLILNKDKKTIRLKLEIDTDICPVLDYFEIFMERTMMSKYAAKYLNLWFELVINDTKLL